MADSIDISRPEMQMREYEPRKKGLMSNDYDEYDPTDLLSCVQDCGRWPLGQRSVNVMTYDPGLDWCAGPANMRVPPPRAPPAGTRCGAWR